MVKKYKAAKTFRIKLFSLYLKASRFFTYQSFWINALNDESIWLFSFVRHFTGYSHSQKSFKDPFESVKSPFSYFYHICLHVIIRK